MTAQLQDRIALITGASRGIGAAVAVAFAREGAHVVLTARTVGGLEEVDDAVQNVGGSATLVPMDLRDTAAIYRLGASLHERHGKLDILVANGAMLGDMTPMHQYEPGLWDEVIGVNLTANQRLIRSLDPLLRASDAGRAIFVTAGEAQGNRAYWGAYAVSKAALETMVRCYAAETAKTNIRANLFNPGATSTGLRAAAYPGEDAETHKAPEALCDMFIELAAPACNRHGDLVEFKD
jgi:NAD(P)-dependent dehydrogenase (short-subunit alcohol dehydrogenase family)